MYLLLKIKKNENKNKNEIILNYPIPLWGLSGIMDHFIQVVHNMVKNPNWQEAHQLAIYKRGRLFELWTTKKNSGKRSGRDLIAGPSDYKSSALNTRPRCLELILSLLVIH